VITGGERHDRKECAKEQEQRKKMLYCFHANMLPGSVIENLFHHNRPLSKIMFSKKICGIGSLLFTTTLFEQKPCQNADMTYNLEIFRE
jgi:hypothetical protein